MVTDAERREVARRLRETAPETYVGLYEAVMGREIPLDTSGGEDARELCGRLADLIEPEPITGNTSDGYHTFDELYDHRAKLFSVVVAALPSRSWKSKRHFDGTMYDGMFIVGIETPGGQATYHCDVDPYWDIFRCKELEHAPEWDGHTPAQAIERIASLADIVRPGVVGADGAEICAGADAWWICDGDERGTHAERLCVESVCRDGLVECSPYNGGTRVYLEPSDLYARKPVLAADGLPLRAGDTVWCEACGGPLSVESVGDDGTVYTDGHLAHSGDDLTHERPDSWGQWRNDMERMYDPRSYCLERGIGGDYDSLVACACLMADDMERRARALAERGM